MNDPHVTNSIFENKENAEQVADYVNTLLPVQVTITGYTIN